MFSTHTGNSSDLSDDLQDLVKALEDATGEIAMACDELTDAELDFGRTPCLETARKRLNAQRGVEAARIAYEEVRQEFEDQWQYEFGMGCS